MATVSSVVRDKLVALFKERQEIVINGVEDWPAYRYQMGYMRGVYDSMDIVLSLLGKLEQEEDEGR